MFGGQFAVAEKRRLPKPSGVAFASSLTARAQAPAIATLGRLPSMRSAEKKPISPAARIAANCSATSPCAVAGNLPNDRYSTPTSRAAASVCRAHGPRPPSPSWASPGERSGPHTRVVWTSTPSAPNAARAAFRYFAAPENGAASTLGNGKSKPSVTALIFTAPILTRQPRDQALSFWPHPPAQLHCAPLPSKRSTNLGADAIAAHPGGLLSTRTRWLERWQSHRHSTACAACPHAQRRPSRHRHTHADGHSGLAAWPGPIVHRPVPRLPRAARYVCRSG